MKRFVAALVFQTQGLFTGTLISRNGKFTIKFVAKLRICFSLV
jgi:hypothetical protein